MYRQYLEANQRSVHEDVGSPWFLCTNGSVRWPLPRQAAPGTKSSTSSGQIIPVPLPFKFDPAKEAAIHKMFEVMDMTKNDARNRRGNVQQHKNPCLLSSLAPGEYREKTRGSLFSKDSKASSRRNN